MMTSVIAISGSNKIVISIQVKLNSLLGMILYTADGQFCHKNANEQKTCNIIIYINVCSTEL